METFPISQGKSYSKCFKKQKEVDDKEKMKKSQVRVKKPAVKSNKRK
jgi:hypothetical protein